MKKPGWISILLLIALLGAGNLTPASAQEQSGSPVYIVQSGDSLWSIAQQFGVPFDQLTAANNIYDATQLNAGDSLFIPGLAGYSGPVITTPLGYGETLASLSRRYTVTLETLLLLNRLTSPDELFAGINLVVPAANPAQPVGRRTTIAPGQSLLEAAAIAGSIPWALAAANHLGNTWETLPGEVLFLPSTTDDGPGGLPSPITGIEVNPLPTVQGKTTVIRIHTSDDLVLGGAWVGQDLHFFKETDNVYVALQGIHALTAPGFYPLTLEGSLADGSPFAYEQAVYVRDGGYLFEAIELPPDVAEKTLDPVITGPENELWFSLTALATAEKRWDGMFLNPSPYPLSTGFPSVFGNRRSYNGSDYEYYHSGLDMFGNVGVEIFAPAAGTVVYTGTLDVRGGATVIDHGWGVYTTYMHQSEILVDVGETVTAGQVIGLVGASGRAQGPHLHFEVWVGNVAVDPLDWLTLIYP